MHTKDLIINEVYQYKDDNYDILGIYIGHYPQTRYSKTGIYEFKTLSSVNNDWILDTFSIYEYQVIENITKL